MYETLISCRELARLIVTKREYDIRRPERSRSLKMPI